MKRVSAPILAIIFFAISTLFSSSAFSAEIEVGWIGTVQSGQRHTVSIVANDIASEISSFNLLIAHDQSMGMVLNIRSGDLHKDYGWEYFTYRQYSKDTVEARWPGFKTSLLNIIGMASPVGNAPLPVDTNSVVLAKFDVILPIVSGSFSDEAWSPFSFFWRDCNDNVLTSFNHDTVYTANALFERKWSSSQHDPVNYSFPGFGIPDHPCSSANGEEVVNKVEFVNSGILFFVIDPVEQCLNGDINLDGFYYQLDDLILFANYLVYGLIVFDQDVAAQIEQTNCNCDGLVLSIADLVCFFRTTIRDPGGAFGRFPVTGSQKIDLSFKDGGHSTSLNLISEGDVALVYLRVISEDTENLLLQSGLSSAQRGQIGDTTTFILINYNGQSVLSEGIHELLRTSKENRITVEAWAVDMDGVVTAYKLDNSILPDSPELLQNYPNPFNPSTTIEFSLPAYSDWKIEIYNVTGRLVKQFNGTSVGRQEVEWDGTNLDGTPVSSGVYFYKLVTNDETYSRKMLLLK